jgi:hypothetical protein
VQHRSDLQLPQLRVVHTEPTADLHAVPPHALDVARPCNRSRASTAFASAVIVMADARSSSPASATLSW